MCQLVAQNSPGQDVIGSRKIVYAVFIFISECGSFKNTFGNTLEIILRQKQWKACYE